MRSQDEKIRQMLDQFSRELLQAINGSPSMSDSVERLRSAGFELHLALGCEQAPSEESANGTPANGTPANGTPHTPTPANADAPPPSFRLNSDDVTFLKSIGIDATRNARRRRKSA